MLSVIQHWYRSRAARPYVRPWGLAMPILVLVVCLPLLRPLLHPTDISQNERERLATIEAIVEHRTLSIDHTSFIPKDRLGPATGPEKHHYSKQPPVMAAILAGPYWIMYHCGLTFGSNPALACYLLTLLGCTLPVAGAAALVYRMGRVFELERPWRTVLAAAAIFGSGLVSYATVLNSHAPAAAMLLAGCAALYHAGTTRQADRSRGWVMFAGLVVALAATIDMAALVFLVLLPLVVLSMRWTVSMKMQSLTWYVLGALAPLVVHAALTIPITGDIRPGFLHANYASQVILVDDSEDAPSLMALTALKLLDGLLGPHGLLTHFPVLLFGIIGLAIVLRRHWPAPTKTLAGVSVLSAILIVGVYGVLNPDWGQPMFAVRWFILFLPLLVFWSGAWLRHKHRPAVWGIAVAVLVFSIFTSLIGAAAPFAPGKRGEYTVYSAAKWLLRGSPSAGYTMLDTNE
ncbi:MAG: hypothetical protein ACHRHE_21615 [Tepidisphaerales bacterium]